MKRGVRGQRSEVKRRHIFGALIFCTFILFLSSFLFPLPSSAQAITTDSRIKTLVYNPNEVFTITTHYGYQSNIEFGLKETIDTISVGDRVAWQIIPAGRRLFIRAMEENAHTNMTVVTNLHAYQFDLRSSAADAVFGSEELTYVVRFFYPGADAANVMPSSSPLFPPLSVTLPVVSAPVTPVPLASPPVVTAPPPAVRPQPILSAVPPAPMNTGTIPPAPMPQPAVRSAGYNYRYTFTGPTDIAPTRIFDDGRTTYFKLPPNQLPQVAMITSLGETIAVPTRRTPSGLVAVDAVAPRFSLNQAGRQVIVYNETGGEMR